MFESGSIEERLKQKLSLMEFGAAVFIFCIGAGMLLPQHGNLYDFMVYLNAAQGKFAGFFYGYWLIPFFYLFSLIPFNLSFFIWIILCIAGVIFSARVFNGNAFLALLSYQLSFSFYYGQISGIICGILALFWFLMHKHNWILAGLALLMAIAKPQSGGVFAFYLWLFADISWKEKFKILIIPLMGVILTFIIYPGWLMDIVVRSKDAPAVFSITLGYWIGPVAVLILVPVLLLPMKKEKKFIALTAGTILSLPYMLHTDVLTFFVFPVGYITVLLGYLPFTMLQIVGNPGLQFGIFILLWIYGEAVLNKNGYDILLSLQIQKYLNPILSGKSPKLMDK